MDPRLNIIIQNFDLKKFNRKCNESACEKEPTKKVVISECGKFDSDKKELVVLHLCTEHLDKLKRILREMDELTERDKMIGIEVEEKGYITH